MQEAYPRWCRWVLFRLLDLLLELVVMLIAVSVSVRRVKPPLASTAWAA